LQLELVCRYCKHQYQLLGIDMQQLHTFELASYCTHSERPYAPPLQLLTYLSAENQVLFALGVQVLP
jgi:hypothetical protein